MKKTLGTILMILISGIANANIHIDGKTAGSIIISHVGEEKKTAALAEYNAQLKATGNYTMSAAGLYKVCIAAGWDIEKPEGKDKCDKFVEALIEKSDYKYYEVCGNDKGKSGGTEHCIDNVFYAGLNTDIKMTMLQADGLCKEYARVKYNDDIECSNEIRGKLNDYVKCTSKLKPIYYEFKFDSVTGVNLDSALHNSVKYSICKIHDTNLGFPESAGINYNAQPVDYNSFCVTSDTAKCSKINESMNKFAYKSFMKDGKCVIEQKSDISKNNLRTAFGIDNHHFNKGYQLSAYSNLREKLCEYVEKNANTKINSCKCDYGFTRVVDNSGLVPEADDVLTCYANGQPIDFVFDDLNENDKKLRQGNMEAFNCSVLGGEYQGKTCFTPDKTLCDQIAVATQKECPECAKAYFDTEKNACVLPSATKANEHQKRVNIGLIVGGTIVGAAVIIYTGGTGFAAVAVAFETLGAGMEIGAQMHIDGVADEFFMKANNCNNETCAEELLKEYFQYISRMVGDLKDGEKLGVDAKMATLVGMLPDDSQFLTDVVAGCYEQGDDNFDISKCDDGNWNGAQVIRAVGVGLQFTSVFASVGKFILTKAGMIEKIANKTPKLTTALSKKIPGAKARIAQKLAKGEKVTRSDGKVVKMSKVTTSGKNTAETNAYKETKQAIIMLNTDVTDVSTLRKAASSNFDTYLAEAKNSKNGKGTSLLPKSRLDDEGWKALNKSLESENVQLVEVTKNGEKYMQFVRVDHVDNVATTTTKAAVETKRVITQEDVYETILRNHQVGQKESVYVRKTYNSGAEGKKWVELWDKHAPKNQSLEKFQAIYGNDLSKAERELDKVDNVFFEDALKEAQDRSLRTQLEYSSTFDAYTSKNGYQKYPEYRKVREANTKATRLTPETPGLEKWTQEEIDEVEKLYKADEASRVAFEAQEAAEEAAKNKLTYSTYDSQVTKINNKYKSQVEKVNKEMDELKQIYSDKTGSAVGYQETTEYKKLQSEYDDIIEQYQYEMGQVALTNKELVAKDIRVKFDELLEKNPQLKLKIDSWDTLSKTEKINLSQDLINAYARENNTPYVLVFGKDMESNVNGAYSTYAKDITLNTTEGGVLDRSSNFALGTLLHEYSHAIDDIVPDKGSIGAQIMKNNLGYTSKGPVYPLAQTEQSSFLVGGEFEYEKNWPLIQAEEWKEAQLEQKANSANKISGFNLGEKTSNFAESAQENKLAKTLDNANSRDKIYMDANDGVSSGTMKKPTTNTNIPKLNVDPTVIKDAGVRNIYQKAYEAEPKITEDLAKIASNKKGELYGLEYRLKTPESTLGKIERDRAELIGKQGASYASKLTDAAIAENFKDIIRYTFTSSPDDLVTETQKVISELKSNGYKIEQIKNTFMDPTNPMDMINMRVVSPNGQVFELQANTPHNVYVKDKLMHADYEAWRVIDNKDSKEAQELSKKMFETAKQFEKPKNIEKLKL